MISAMLFAGGSGTRMGASDIPKQFLEIEGRSIIIRTMEHFQRHSMVDSIVVACKEDWIDELRAQTERFGMTKLRKIVPGGRTGFESIHNGVVAVAEFQKNDDDLILICDGVRPMLSERLISDCIENARKYETAVPVTPSIDSLLFSENGDECQKSYDRNRMYITQAPQGYTMKKILWAHDEAEKRGILNPISSSELIIELGEPVRLFKGERNNIKVTTSEDMDTLRAYFYYQRYKTFAEEVSRYGF